MPPIMVDPFENMPPIDMPDGSHMDLLQLLLGSLDPHVIEQMFAAHSGADAARGDLRPVGPPPTSAAALRLLPKIKVTDHDIDANESSECTICMEDLIVSQPALRIPCGHLYHEACIKDWLLKSNECPVCRYELPTDDMEYEKGRKERMAGRTIRMRHADLAVKTPKELRQLAQHLGIDITGCLEKGEIVNCIAASSRVSIIKDEGTDLGSASTGSTAPGLRIMSKGQLEDMSVEDLSQLMDELGVDAEGFTEKAVLVQRLVLSGRVVLTQS